MATKVQVVFYSTYGHLHKMAEAIAAGAREIKDVEVTVLQVPELMPEDVLEKSGAKAARAAFANVPLAKVEQLAEADAIIFGTPYGASTLAGPDGSRQPSANELAIAQFQGKHVATIASQLKRGRG